MAKSLLRIEARKLREQGISVKSIAGQLGVSKGSVSLWVRDLVLTVEQLEKLKQHSIKGSKLGRLRGSLVQKQRRLDLIELSKRQGISLISDLTNRELLLAGLALYWGEGSKKKRDVEFYNSDPKVIQFLILWLQKCFNIKVDELTGYIKIDGIHTQRDQLIKEYWSGISDIPVSQFRKTHFKQAANKKIYENFDNYYGTFSVRVRKSGSLYYKIMGLIEGLYNGSGKSSLSLNHFSDKIPIYKAG